MRSYLPLVAVGFTLGLVAGCGSVSGISDGGGGTGGGGTTGAGGTTAGQGGGAAGQGGGAAGQGGGAAGEGGHSGGGSTGRGGSGGGGSAGRGGSGGAGSTGRGGSGGGAGSTGRAGSGGGGSGGSTGGASGGGGHATDGGVSCSDFENQYAAQMPAAQSCDLNKTGECQKLASTSLSPCAVNCMTYVNDSSKLDAIKKSWEDAGCNAVVVFCPAIACVQPLNDMCKKGDGGGGKCSTGGVQTN